MIISISGVYNWEVRGSDKTIRKIYEMIRCIMNTSAGQLIVNFRTLFDHAGRMPNEASLLTRGDSLFMVQQ